MSGDPSGAPAWVRDIARVGAGPGWFEPDGVVWRVHGDLSTLVGGVAALLGQAGRIENKEFLAAALTMHSVEGRHAATIAELLGENPAPQGPYAKPVFAADVINQLQSLTAPG